MINERRWLKRCRNGDTKAFSRLYESYIDRIYDFVYFKTYHKEIAAILDQSEGQCKMTFYRLIEKMKQELPAALVLLFVVTKNIIR